ncbi:GNAT family N-acetyltransferase [Paenibacillus solani]|uniref:GCN5 family acetyltransferase n=1 Tax=Paenibacillus solani TaxID=1705565 RepID=A0A0M1P635_9BACL|nr:GNAT family N-acetyltransferase [Paenibacillus solani]KOR89852.1 GCN5 family acetyltransferase [Paenibacillus solani]
MMQLPSEELMVRIQQSETDYMYDRMKAIEERAGNPEGVEMAYFGHALCLYSKTMPWPSFNTVKGIRSEDVVHLDAILDFYKSRNRSFQFELVPGMVNQELLAELAKRGFYQSGFHNSLYINPQELKEVPDTGIVIKTIDNDDFEDYAKVHCLGTGLPDQGIPSVASNNRVLYSRPGWKFYMAYIKGQPAAAGVMHVNHSTASLTFAATLPEFRRQGLHQELLRKRIREAKLEGCNLVVSQCAFLSQSHRNMDAIGMKLAYVRTTWTERQ